jgi:hypothetical protein
LLPLLSASKAGASSPHSKVGGIDEPGRALSVPHLRNINTAVSGLYHCDHDYCERFWCPVSSMVVVGGKYQTRSASLTT